MKLQFINDVTPIAQALNCTRSSAPKLNKIAKTTGAQISGTRGTPSMMCLNARNLRSSAINATSDLQDWMFAVVISPPCFVYTVV